MTYIGLNSAVATAVFALIFVFIGVPVWWKTTEVYRFPIPHKKLEDLLNYEMVHAVPVRIVLCDRSVKQSDLWKSLLMFASDDSSEPAFAFEWSMSTVSAQEESLILKYNSLRELDAAFEFEDSSWPSGDMKILVLTQDVSRNVTCLIGNRNTGYIVHNGDTKDLASSLFHLVRKMALVSRLRKLYVSPAAYSGDMKPDKERMRHLRSTTSFDITFSILVPEPQILDVRWNIQRAIDAYLNPFLKAISMMYTVNVKSQFLFMTSLPLPKRMDTDSNGENIVHSDILPSIINVAEARLGSDTSVNPSLNLILYIPTKEQTPLRIYDSAGDPIPSNAFLVPQWGSFMFYNWGLPEKASLPHTLDLQEREIMGVFLMHLRLLLGLPPMSEMDDEKCELLSNSSLSAWELDFLLRKNAQDHLSATASSLSSLSRLLNSIGNIVIRKDVGEKIFEALSAAHRSLDLLSKGQLTEGFLSAREAFIKSDEAFFDPSLLALLYFPEDQKYAVYIPLFLPVSIPVITSLSRLWKFYKEERTKVKVD